MELDTIFKGDTGAYLPTLPAGTVDLVVSSPPYNLGKEYESRKALQHYIEEQTVVLRECCRLLKNTGSIFWQVGSYSEDGTLIPLDIRFFPVLEGFGMRPRNRIVWARQHGLHGRRKFSCRYETILWFTKTDEFTFNLDAIRVPQKYQNKKAHKGERKGEYTCNPEGKNPGDIWLFRNVKHNHEEQTIHPCQFPEDLVARIVLATTTDGGIVLDPYMGAGTVAVVARDHNRHFLGAELDPEYHKIAERRLAGEPDENGRFPNLKTLRNYVQRHGKPAHLYKFDMQVGKYATEREKAKIYSEEHHLAEFEERLSYEEMAFACKTRGEQVPVDPKLNGSGKPTPVMSKTPSLFD
ncbi:MAG TPA: site-specific DNA-methyltransferase [Terriglobia bacterium]|nr:site-specific DNA-methyltransferase [Terriglobia bacterium]